MPITKNAENTMPAIGAIANMGARTDCGTKRNAIAVIWQATGSGSSISESSSCGAWLSSLREDFLRDRQRRHCVGPARIKCEMRDHLGCFVLSEPVVHRSIQVKRDLSDLPRRDKRGHRDEAAIARCEFRAQPQIPKQVVGCVS